MGDVNLKHYKFENHDYITEVHEFGRNYILKKKNQYAHSVWFMNQHGKLLVGGDYGQWALCREFHPGEKDFKLDVGYFAEKISIGGYAKVEKYDPELTEKRINEMINDDEYKEDSEIVKWLINLKEYVDEERDYYQEAFYCMPSNIEYEEVPYEMSLPFRIHIIVSAFNEMCKREKDLNNEFKKYHFSDWS